MSTQEALETLGLRQGATTADIRAAYRRQSLKYHPDQGGDSWVFRRVTEAYQHLTNGDIACDVPEREDPVQPPVQTQSPPSAPVNVLSSWSGIVAGAVFGGLIASILAGFFQTNVIAAAIIGLIAGAIGVGVASRPT